MSTVRKRLCFAMMSVAGAAILAGCAELPRDGNNPMADAARTCMAEHKHFTDAWGCVQARYADTSDSPADPRSTEVLKAGDALASQVAARKLTDSEARKQLLARLADASGGPAAPMPTSLLGFANP